MPVLLPCLGIDVTNTVFVCLVGQCRRPHGRFVDTVWRRRSSSVGDGVAYRLQSPVAASAVPSRSSASPSALSAGQHAPVLEHIAAAVVQRAYRAHRLHVFAARLRRLTGRGPSAFRTPPPPGAAPASRGVLGLSAAAVALCSIATCLVLGQRFLTDDVKVRSAARRFPNVGVRGRAFWALTGFCGGRVALPGRTGVAGRVWCQWCCRRCLL